MSLTVYNAIEYIHSKIPDADISCVGATIFVREASDEAVEALEGDETSGRTLAVNTDNNHTDAAIVKLTR